MTFQPISLDTLPKRTAPVRKVDMEAANALLAIVQSNGGATDGTAYATLDEARKAGNVARRLLDHAAPEGQKARMRSFPLDSGKGFGFAVFLGEATERKQRADAGKPRNAKGK